MVVSGMDEEKDIIEILDSDDEIIVKPIDNKELYDINGNLITANDPQSALPDNEELIQKAIGGDKKAFETLYMQSYRYVFFTARQFVPDDETTYDIIQEVFIKVYKNISNLSSPKAYYSWLTTIAKNTARDFMRTVRFETPLSYEEEDYSAFLKDDETRKDISLDIETVLKKMDPDEAELLSLVYYDGMRIAQIAKMQGVPATTVYSRFNKAKKNLKAQLNARGIDKAIYSGNFVAMITTAIRNIIGTALLSFAIAQQILNSVIGKNSKKEIAIANIIRSHQKKLALKIASCLVAIAMFTSALTVLSLVDWKNFLSSTNEKQIIEYYYTTEQQESDEKGASSESSYGFWQNLFGGSINQSADNSNDTSSSGGFWSNLIGDSDDGKDKSESSSSSSLGNFFQNLFENGIINNGDSSNNDSHKNISPNASSNNSHENESGVSSDDFVASNDSTTGSDSSTSSTSSIDSASSESTSSSTVSETFTPNCDPMKYEKSGNMWHNTTTHAGLVAKQDDWIYYVATVNDVFGLYKVKEDGTKKQLVTTKIEKKPYLNIIDEWIYFLYGETSEKYIVKVKTDGSGWEQISNIPAINLQVFDNTAYFLSDILTDSCNYYKINLTTGSTTLLASGLNSKYACMTDKYFMCMPIMLNSDFCVYERSSGKLVCRFDNGYCAYQNKIIVYDEWLNENNQNVCTSKIYDLANLDAEPITIANFWCFAFFSPHDGGVIGGIEREPYESWGLMSSYRVRNITTLEHWAWCLGWTFLKDCYNYSTYDDGYVYYVDETTLHRVRPAKYPGDRNGTEF